MDATRARRTEDRVRQIWYAHWRQLRFARFMGVVKRGPVAIAGWPTAGDYLICPLMASLQSSVAPVSFVVK